MRYLIDGNNLIGHERGLSLADAASRGALVRALCALSRRTGKRITVVFDGPAPGRSTARSDLGKVRVLYAGDGRPAMSADERILRLLQEEQRPRELTVVTSDRPLADRARTRGAATLPCHRFRPLLRGAAEAEARSGEKPTHVDVRQWAEYFGVDPDSEPRSSSSVPSGPSPGTRGSRTGR